MSTTTEKPSILDNLKAQAQEIADKIKAETDKHLATLHEKLKAAHEVVTSLTAEIEKHTGKPAAPKRRGRKPGSTNKAKAAAAKPAKKKGGKAKGKRGALGESITKVLSVAGKKGIHVKEIADKVGSKPANVTAWMYSTGKSKVKNLGKATFALKG